MSERVNKLIEDVKNDPEIQELLNKNAIKLEDIAENVIELDTYRKAAAICRKCQGLEYCQSKIPGCFYSLDKNFRPAFKVCHYKREKDEIVKHKANYLICDLSYNALQNDIDKIDLSHESKEYVNVVTITKDWLNKNPSRGIYYYGICGVGKSYLASCITNSLAKQGKKVAFVNVPQLSFDLKANMYDDDYIEDKIYNLKRAYVLVLDDIGAQKDSDWFLDDILLPVLDYRMNNSKRTFFTSNNNVEQLEKRFAVSGKNSDELRAARLMERIKTLALPVVMTGQTRRK